MSFKNFVNESGLKVLAMTRLTQCEYSLAMYLLNCSASGLDEFITTSRELSSLIGYDLSELNEACLKLVDKNIIHMRSADPLAPPSDRQSVRIGLNFDIVSWRINQDKAATSQDAIVFPFKRGSNLQLINGDKEKEPVVEIIKPVSSLPTWKRVLNSFTDGRDLDEAEMLQAERDARVLVDTHPIDQVLLMLRHFRQRIPTLSLLASSWQHYQEAFEEETQKVDIADARQKHLELDHKLREKVEETLERKEDLNLTEEEITVLEILYSHRHPRRQLFWAYQARSRYPNLKVFFEENAKRMLSVTSNGTIVKRRPEA